MTPLYQPSGHLSLAACCPRTCVAFESFNPYHLLLERWWSFDYCRRGSLGESSCVGPESPPAASSSPPAADAAVIGAAGSSGGS